MSSVPLQSCLLQNCRNRQMRVPEPLKTFSVQVLSLKANLVLYRLFSKRPSVNSIHIMGRNKNFKRHKYQTMQQKNEQNYVSTVRDNELFKNFYKGLNVVPESEWDEFYNRLKEPLPVVFRITGYKSQARELLRIIRTQFFDMIGTSTASSTLPGNRDSASGTRETQDQPDQLPAIKVEPSSDGFPSAESDTVGNTIKQESDLSGGVGVLLQREDIKPPMCLSWYPDHLAWQLNFSRKAIRSEEILNKFHKFLVCETEIGNISRQEAVSMIPPLVLDIRPNSRVLDMCASPGSKTAQLIEYLHKDESAVPEGFVVANDWDNKRCYLMVHQVKRLSSPCCMIVNHDAAFFPKLQSTLYSEKPQVLLFDRILADVPCSGDGTIRKNIDVWKKWTPNMGYGLHGLQLKIVKRGLELLETGGRLVYSTCSMHPVEDEAVVAEMLRQCQGSVELVDVSSSLPGLKYVPGLSNWRLMTKTGQWIENHDEVPQHLRSQMTKTMFPPTPEEAERFNLHRCIRVLAHHQDTGGFFIAVLHKIQHLPWSREARLCQEGKTSLAEEGGHDDRMGNTPPTAEQAEDDDKMGNTPPTTEQAEDDDKMGNTPPTTEQAGDDDKMGNTPPTTEQAGDDDKMGNTPPTTEQAGDDDKMGNTPPTAEQAGDDDRMDDTPSTAEEGGACVESNQNSSGTLSLPENRKRKAEIEEGLQPKKQPFKGYKEDPFLFLQPDDSVWGPVRDFYGLGEDFPVRQLLYRSEQGPKRCLYFVSKALANIVENNREKLRFINMGVKTLTRSPSPVVPECDFRLTQECMGSLRDLFAKRRVFITAHDVVVILSQESPFFCKLSQSTQDVIAKTDPGSVVFVFRPTESEPEPSCEVTFCGWRGRTTVRSFVPRFEREHCLRLFGKDLQEMNDEVQQRKKAKEMETTAAVAANDSSNAADVPSPEQDQDTASIKTETGLPSIADDDGVQGFPEEVDAVKKGNLEMEAAEDGVANITSTSAVEEGSNLQ